MSFGLCIELATFKGCMMSIFSDMVKDNIEVPMDNLSFVGFSFDSFIDHLVEVIKR